MTPNPKTAACGVMRRAMVVTWALLALAARSAPAAMAEASASIAFGPAGREIPADFSGLSFEVQLVLPGADGQHYFRPDNLALVRLFRTLGVRNLRIGGNTSDRNARGLPGEADLDALFAFARAAGVRVIYCLRLHDGDPQADARTARYLLDRYGPLVDCFSIGQEPSAYPREEIDTRPAAERMGAAAEKYPYSAYRDQWRRFAQVISAAAPGARFCGPSVHNNAAWARQFLDDFARGYHVVLLTEHLYPGGAGGKVPSPAVGRDRMLGDAFTKVEQRLYDGLGPAAAAAGLPYRLEEVNNYFNGGAADVSNTFAAALWGLDFMYWWAAHGAAGLNFHTGDRVAAGSDLRPSRYTAYYSVPGGFEVRPLGYGIKAFALAGPGRFVPARIAANAARLNLSAYGVRSPDGGLTVTLINKEHGPTGRSVRVSLSPGQGGRGAEIVWLAAPENDVAANAGVTLGGGPIDRDGRWRGSWQPLPGPEADGQFTVRLPAASAAVIRFPPR